MAACRGLWRPDEAPPFLIPGGSQAPGIEDDARRYAHQTPPSVYHPIALLAAKELDRVSRLTLSFDNGPFPGVTEDVLETLHDFGLRTTFFVCGKDVRDPARRALVERARDEGHGVGNHTLTHSVELGATDDPGAPASEIGAAQEILEGLTDERRLFRPSGGGGVLGPRLLSPGAVEYLRAGGYTLVLWNSVPRDWEDPMSWPERALEDLARQPWTLVVLHDVPTGAMKQLRRFLDAAIRRGTEIVQELPPACVPIARGEVTGDLDGLVCGGWPASSP